MFLDGAHTWQVEALALALALLDRSLAPGGHFDFDDDSWSVGSSPTMLSQVNLPSAERYNTEQIQAQHLRLIDLLVRRDERHVEVVPNKVFRKDRP